MPAFAKRLTASAETLAAFRVAVAFALFFNTELRDATRFAALPSSARIAPFGLEWFLAFVAPSPAVGIANAVRALALGAAVATMLGLYTRASTVVLFITSFYLLALGELGGTVVHNMHLLWFAAILATSRCGDAYSVDRWWEARERGAPLPPASPSSTYGVPVWTARVLFACIYFFPGLHKLLTQGLGWASADNLALQLQWKWFQWNDVPAFRLDRHPALLSAGGFGTLAFELGFPLALLHKKTRALAAAAGLAFHLATDHFFRIPFSSLWLCYPVLFDWPSRASSSASEGPRVSDAPAWPRAPTIYACIVITLVIIQGARGDMNAYPFGCYPTFAARPPDTVPDLRIVAVMPDGATRDVRHARDASGVRAQADWGRIWAIAGVTAPFDERRALDYARAALRSEASSWRDAERIELRLARYDVSPDARGGPPRSEKVLASMPVSGHD